MELKVTSQGGQPNLTLEKNDTLLISTSDKDVIEGLEEIGNTKDDNSKEELDKAMHKLNKFLEDEKKHAEYRIHDDLNRVMIKIIDDNTNETIMEVPPEKLLDAVAMMCKAAGLLVDKKV